jgi:hypothetical protein
MSRKKCRLFMERLKREREKFQDDLIRDFSEYFTLRGESTLISLVRVEPGWFRLIEELLREMKSREMELVIHQIKEKFGCIRIYISFNDNPEIYDLIDEYSEKSRRICERCGSQDGMTEHLFSGKLIKTFCTDCKDLYLKEGF